MLTIEASANHISITESFTQGIVAINDAVAMANNSQVYSTPEIQQLIMRLYTEVFVYLTKFMAWYTDRSRNRFLKSFNENLSREFGDDLENIKHLAGLLCNQVQLHTSADVRVSKLVTEELSDNVKFLVRNVETIGRQSTLLEDFCEQLKHDIHSSFRETTKQALRDLANELLTQKLAGDGMISLLEQQASPNRTVTPDETHTGNITGELKQHVTAKMPPSKWLT